MKDYSSSVAPIVKADKFNLNQCLKHDLEKKEMENIHYVSTIESLLTYVQVVQDLKLHMQCKCWVAIKGIQV